MSKAPTGTWVCPVCSRRVPRREAECFCGTKQAQAEQHQQREEQKRSTRIPLDVAFIVVLLVLGGVYTLHRVTRAEPDEAPAGARNFGAIMATPEPEPALSVPAEPSRAPRRIPAAGVAPASAPPPPLPPPATPAPGLEPPRAAASEAPYPTAAPVDEQERVRAAGLAAYVAELQRLSAAAARLDARVRDHKTECGETQKFAYAVSNCAELESAVKREVAQIQSALDAAEDQARRAWLQPGTVRDARARSVFGTRQWDELLGAARNLKR